MRSKAALAGARQASFNYIDAKNKAIKKAVSDYERLYASRLSKTALLAAAQAAKVSLDAIRKEYEVGRKSLSDVLKAEEQHLSAATAAIAAEKDELSYLFTALADVGMMSIDLFE